MKTYCPHCKSLCTTRDTRQLSDLYREVTFVCKNSDCGHVFVTSVEPVRTLSPSAMPDPNVNLPLSENLKASLALLFRQNSKS